MTPLLCQLKKSRPFVSAAPNLLLMEFLLNSEPFVSRWLAASLLSVSPQRVDVLINTGKLKIVVLNGCRHVYVSSIATRLLEKSKVKFSKSLA